MVNQRTGHIEPFQTTLPAISEVDNDNCVFRIAMETKCNSLHATQFNLNCGFLSIYWIYFKFKMRAGRLVGRSFRSFEIIPEIVRYCNKIIRNY